LSARSFYLAFNFSSELKSVEPIESRAGLDAALKKGAALQKALRILCGLLFILIFCAAIWASIKVGFSRLFSYYGEGQTLDQPLLLAVQMTPGDPEAHYLRARVLEDAGNLSEAIKEFEQAVSLRPSDYVMWQELGLAHDRVNDEQGAVSALTESVRLAPFYSQPRWQLGNILFRAGRYEEAFAEMRRAVMNDSMLLPNFIDLTWGAYRGDTVAMEQVIRPERDEWRLALAKFYAAHGKFSEATGMVKSLHELSASDRQLLVSMLLKGKQFHAAYDVMSGGASAGSPVQMPTFLNGGFEDRVSLEEQSFGWQIARNSPAIAISQDGSQHHSGSYSLRVEWNGDSPADTPALSQIILTEPNKRYVIKFAVRTEKIVSGGLPIMAVSDITGNENRALVQSKPLPQNTEGWTEYSLEFTTGAATEAVLVTLRREACTTAPCPAFGKVWLDDFEIQKVN